ncbi:MAG: DUF3592 domain-containing protein [Sciscionella sp.]
MTRKRRRIATGLLSFAVLVSALCLLLLVATVQDDASIEARTGRATAEVISITLGRTLVVFDTPDGRVHAPHNGVLYPRGLHVGDRVRVEYDTDDPNLVRVAGRDAKLALLPTGSTMLGTWAVCLPLALWLRRPRTTGAPAPAPTLPAADPALPARDTAAATRDTPA